MRTLRTCTNKSDDISVLDLPAPKKHQGLIFQRTEEQKYHSSKVNNGCRTLGSWIDTKQGETNAWYRCWRLSNAYCLARTTNLWQDTRKLQPMTTPPLFRNEGKSQLQCLVDPIYLNNAKEIKFGSSSST